METGSALGLQDLGGRAHRGKRVLAQFRQQSFDGAVGGGAFAQALQIGTGMGEMLAQDFPILPHGVHRSFHRRRGRSQIQWDRFAGITRLKIRQRLRQGLQFDAGLFDGLLVLLQLPALALDLQLPLQLSAIDGVVVALGTAHIALLSDL